MRSPTPAGVFADALSTPEPHCRLRPRISNPKGVGRLPAGRHDMIQSHPIEVDGVFVGAAVRLDHGYRFVALSLRLDDLDGVVRPDLQAIRVLAHRAFRGGEDACAHAPPARPHADAALS